MYQFLQVVKFNNVYFEHGDVVTVTLTDGTAYTGSIVIKDEHLYSNVYTDGYALWLNTSEKYKLELKSFHHSKIATIEKVIPDTAKINIDAFIKALHNPEA